MAEGGAPQADIAELCGVGLRTVQRILAETAPTRDEVVAGERACTRHVGRPPKADATMVERLRPKPRQEPIVRFEGLPGEYTQFDFGVSDQEPSSRSARGAEAQCGPLDAYELSMSDASIVPVGLPDES